MVLRSKKYDMAAITATEERRDWKTVLSKDTLPDYGLTVSFLGVRASGKTFLLNHVVREMHRTGKRRYTAAFLFSATAFTQKGSYKWIPEAHKFTTLHALNDILKRQAEVCDLNAELEKNKDSAHFIRSAVVIVVDDFVNFNLRSSKQVTGLYTHGRHLGHKKSGSLIDIFTLGQDIVQLAPVSFLTKVLVSVPTLYEKYLKQENNRFNGQTVTSSSPPER